MTQRLKLLPQTRPMEWQDWVDTVVGFNPILRNKISADLHWEEFAERLKLIVPESPDPRLFESWQAWGDALRRAQSF